MIGREEPTLGGQCIEVVQQDAGADESFAVHFEEGANASLVSVNGSALGIGTFTFAPRRPGKEGFIAELALELLRRQQIGRHQ